MKIKFLAKYFEINENVKLYAKLPNWFKVATPLGSYNPDWQFLLNKMAKKNFILS